MRRVFAVLLCIALVFCFLPTVPLAEGETVKSAFWKGVPGEPETYNDLEHVVTVGDAVYQAENNTCAGIVIYSLDGVPILPPSIHDTNDEIVVLSNVTYPGHIGFRELYLLGDASVVTEEGYIISGSSAEGTPKEPFNLEILNVGGLLAGIAGAELKYTITEDKDIENHWSVYDLKVDADCTLKIADPDPGDEFVNRLIVEHSLVVNEGGALIADEGQILEIWAGRENVHGLDLYNTDGIKLDLSGSEPEEFEFKEGKWTRIPGGPPGGGDGGGGDPPPDGGEQCKITLVFDGEKGEVTLNGDGEPPGDRYFNKETSVEIRIEAKDGYKISTVGIDGDVTNVDHLQYIFQIENINEDVTITVEFEPVTYTITAVVYDEGGTIDPSGVIGPLTYGDDRQFLISADNGYKIDAVIVNGEAFEDHYGRSFIYEFRDIRDNYTISAEFSQKGDGSFHKITFETGGIGTVEAEGIDDGYVYIDDGDVYVQDGFDFTFTIEPDDGYRISSILQNEEDITRYLIIRDDGEFELTLPEVSEELTVEITFEEETIDGLLCKSYAVVMEDDGDDANDAEEITSELVKEFGYLGYAIEPGKVTVSDIDTSGIDNFGYGTFKFTVTVEEETSEPQTGYIVPEFSDIIFKYEGSYKGTPIAESDKIRIAHAEDGEKGLFSAPAMDSGTIEFIGPYYFHMEGWTSPDTVDSFGEEGGVSKLTVVKSFYRVQLHLANGIGMPNPGDPPEEKALNWFGFDLIQDDAYCVKVDAKSGDETQFAIQWSLNRYAVLNSGNYVSKVFFGNNTFEISIPEDGIGGVTYISLATGDFQGYTVTQTEPGRKFEVFFKSNFYDRITLDVTINGEEIPLTIHRVGVDIQKDVYNPDRGPDVNVFHGTQFSTAIDYSDGNHYRIYATYCIPDGGTVAPYGLYVTYTFADGTKTSETITEYCDNPSPNKNAEEYSNGVFIYDTAAACCDYLIYAAEDETDAPVKVNVTVLKDDPHADGAFGGIFFGSGAGVEWENE